MAVMDWKAQATAKRECVLALVPEKWRLKNPVPSVKEQRDVTGPYIQQFLSPEEIQITETDALGIVKMTTTGQWTATAVAEAFCHRAAIAHQLVSCLHEIFFEAAVQEAAKMDAYYATHNKPIGPLHGLPVSLKDQFHVRGVETTMGYVGWIGTFEGKKGTGKEKVYESEMVRELRELGAVLYCKTSVPHTLMTGETVNNIIGYTWNPTNRNLACGGSSGGEGALISLRGSPIGFGTDIGGSIRIPAAFNGLFGIRPSHGRLPYEGMANSMDGQNSILSVVGPIATSIPSLRLIIQALLTQQPWLHDPLVNELPWRPEQEKEIVDYMSSGKLAFGIMKHDGTVTPHPPVRRAMDMVVKALGKASQQVIEWTPPSHERGYGIGLKTWVYDGGLDVHKAFGLSGEPVAEQISYTYGEKPFEEAKASEIAATNVAKREYQKEYMEYWNSTAELTETGRPVEAFIMPVAPFAAARPHSYKYVGYSGIINCLDYTSVIIPVTKVDKTVDMVDKGYVPANEDDKAVYESYDADVYDGAHVAVQIVGRRLQEEKTLALAEIVSSYLKDL